MNLPDNVRRALDGYGIPDIGAMPAAELERLLNGFRLVPTYPWEDYSRARGYVDIIQAELAARRRGGFAETS